MTRVQKWGNSQGIRISRELLAQADIDVGEAVQVSADGGRLVVTPARLVRGGVSLEELVGRIPRDYRPGEIEWGPPAGGEVW